MISGFTFRAFTCELPYLKAPKKGRVSKISTFVVGILFGFQVEKIVANVGMEWTEKNQVFPRILVRDAFYGALLPSPLRYAGVLVMARIVGGIITSNSTVDKQM